MTAQMSDLVIFQNARYALCAISGATLFNPYEYALKPVAPHTACYRGWIAEYEVSDCLFLCNLSIHHDSGVTTRQRIPNGPPINGVSPSPPKKEYSFNCEYYDLQLPLDYTGGIVIGKDFVGRPGRVMAHCQFWQFESVFELTFLAGILKNTQDKSPISQKIQERFIEESFIGYQHLRRDDEILTWIRSSFSFEYQEFS